MKTLMEFKGTKEPWYLGRKIQIPNIPGSYYTQIRSGVHYVIGRVYGTHKEENQANAKLIAAAPELLESSLRLIKKLGNDTPWWIMDECDDLKTAIKKAL